MKKIVVYLICIFIIADALALVVWWTHPQGARKMGYSGEIPFALPIKLPWEVVVKGSGAPAPAEPLPESVTTPPAEQIRKSAPRRRRAPRKREDGHDDHGDHDDEEPAAEKSEDASQLLSDPFANYE